MTKIVCFHGCGQTPNLFKSLLKSLIKKDHEWVFPKGPYHNKDGGWGWYIRNYDEDEGEESIKITSDIQKYNDSVLIGFSEGAEYALELSQHLQNICGVVAISPSYNKNIQKIKIKCPVVLISSINEDKVCKKYIKKWKKIIDGDSLTEINHFKGHKVYLPEKIRKIINEKMGL